MTAAASSFRQRDWAFALTLCLVVSALRLMWPGDTQWINDEPLFLSKAAAINAGQSSVGSGLLGTVGLTYGPVAVWIFAALLRISSDLMHVVLMRTALWCVTSSIALLWLARLSTRLRPLFLCLVLLSPYTWLYSRHLWDNTWLMPLGALALAGYVAFHQAQATWKLAVAVLAMALAVLIHPMVLPLGIVLLVHLLRFHGTWLRTNPKVVVALCVTCLLLAAPWLWFLAQQLLAKKAVLPPPPPPPLLPPAEAPVPFWRSLVFPFLGGLQLTGLGLDYFLGVNFWQHTAWVQPLMLVTTAAQLLVWLGMWLAAKEVRAGLRTPNQQGLEFHLALLCVATFCVQWCMQVIVRRHTHPHYYNGTWICYVYFFSLALSSKLASTWQRAARVGVATVLALSLSTVTTAMALQLHQQGGTTGLHFGATLQNQLQVARTLGRYHPDSPIRIEVKNYLMFPHALPMLRVLTHSTGDPNAPLRTLQVRYQDPSGATGWIKVDEAPTAQP